MNVRTTTSGQVQILAKLNAIIRQLTTAAVGKPAPVKRGAAIVIVNETTKAYKRMVT